MDGCPHQDLNLEPRPLEAVNAKPLHLAGIRLESGGQDGCCPRCLLPDKQASLLFFFMTFG